MLHGNIKRLQIDKMKVILTLLQSYSPTIWDIDTYDDIESQVMGACHCLS